MEDNASKGIVVYRELTSWHNNSLKITLTVPLMMIITCLRCVYTKVKYNYDIFRLIGVSFIKRDLKG